MHDVEVSTARISAEFREGVQAHGGEVIDRYDDGARLYLRSVAAFVDKVRPQDQVQGGVALRMVAPEIVVAPYLLRLVCTNGSVAAHTVSTWRIRYSDYPSEEVIIEELRQAIQSCSRPSVFQAEIEKIRTTTQKRAEAGRAAIAAQPEAMRRSIVAQAEATRRSIAAQAEARRETIDEIIAMVEEKSSLGQKVIASRLELARQRAAVADTRPAALREIRAALGRELTWQREVLRTLDVLEAEFRRGARDPYRSRREPVNKPRAGLEALPARVRRRISKRFSESPDRSRFWLMNAVTSVARDTSDPELKWNLEVLGGAIGAGVVDARSLGILRDSIQRKRIIRRTGRVPDGQQQTQKTQYDEVNEAMSASS